MSGVDSLPEGWVSCRLGEVATFVMGQAPPGTASNFEGRGTPFVKAGEFGSLRPLIREWTTQPLKYAESGDVLICVVGATAGKLNLGAECAIGRSVAAIRPVPGLEQVYLYNFLLLKVAELRAGSTGSAQGVISQTDLSKIEIALPPVAEQKRIITCLTQLRSRSDVVRGAMQQTAPLLDQFRRSVLAAAFRGNLTADWRAENPGVEPAAQLRERLLRTSEKASHSTDILLPKLPYTWCYSTLGEVFNVHVGSTPSRREQAFWGGGIPWVSSGEVAFCRITGTRETISSEGLAKSATKLHPPGTVLVGMIGEGRTRGQVAILDISAANNQNSAAIRVSETPILPEYVYHYLSFRYQLTRRAGSGNNQPALNKSRVQAIELPLAPVAEQREVVARVSVYFAYAQRIAELCRDSERDLRRLELSILGKAFRGELVPQDPEDEPASVLLERIRAEREREGAGKPARRGRKAKSGA